MTQPQPEQEYDSQRDTPHQQIILYTSSQVQRQQEHDNQRARQIIHIGRPHALQRLISFAENPGQTVNNGIRELGNVIADAFGDRIRKKRGTPATLAQNIHSEFGSSPEDIVQKLELLFKKFAKQELSDRDQEGFSVEDTEWLIRVQGLCLEMMGFASVKAKPELRVEVFKQIFRLCTSYPRLRFFFLLSNYFASPSNGPMREISQSSFWTRGDGTDPKWTFYQPLALHSLEENEITARMEECRAKKLGQLETGDPPKVFILRQLLTIHLEHNVIKMSMIICSPRGASGPLRQIALRCISCILGLNRFWDNPANETWNTINQLLREARDLYLDVCKTRHSETPNEIQDIEGIDLLISCHY
ncbi:hypothetical protein M422DRAFT_52305 [Sphaerobolus stellatus SS14]|uniref:Uncharacterized protein n=1 Tax=Sphaerobolus stellatus (strain SS14) TaxID=990650 RepID=A0A0C9UG83_SPHS4|nr:hypothetical protein M422DRAFT_52305 [Sphaerobolus stellatus SS14]